MLKYVYHFEKKLNSNIKRLFLVALIILLLPCICTAGHILLKNGQKIEVKTVWETAETVYGLSTNNDVIVLPKEYIKNITAPKCNNSNSPQSPVLQIETGKHDDRITNIFFIKNGKQLLTTSQDKTIRIWHIQSGNLIRVLKNHIGTGEEGKIVAADLSSDNKLLAIGGYLGDNIPEELILFTRSFLLDRYGDIRVINLQTNKIDAILKGHIASIHTLSFSGDGSRIISAAFSGWPRLWDMHTNKTIKEFKSIHSNDNTKRFLVRSVGGHTTISPDGKRVITGANLWDAETGKFIASLKDQQADKYIEHKKNYWSRQISKKSISTLTKQEQYEYIDPETGHIFDHYWERYDGLWMFTPDGKYIVSRHPKNKLMLWDGHNGSFIKNLAADIPPPNNNCSRCNYLNISTNGALIAVGTWMGPGKTEWDILNFSSTTQSVTSLATYTNIPLGPTAISPDNSIAATGSSKDNIIYIWDIKTGQIIQTLDNDITANCFLMRKADELKSQIVSSDGYGYLSENMSLAETRAAAFADAKRQAVEKVKMILRTNAINYQTILSESESIVKILEQKDYGVEENTKYHVWINADITYGLMSKKTADNLASGKIWGVGFAKDGRSIAWGKKDSRHSGFVDVKLDQAFQLFNKNQEPDLQLGDAIYNDSHYLRSIVASGNFTASTECNILYLKKINQNSKSFGLDITNVYSYTFTPDGKLLICAGDRGAIQAIKPDEVYNGQESYTKQYEFIGHTGNIWGLAISPDGRFLISGSDDKTVKIWPLNSNKRVIKPILSIFHDIDDEWIAWTPDGYYVSSLHGDKYIGWLINNGENKLSDYYSAYQFERIFYRPDIVYSRLKADSKSMPTEYNEEENLFDIKNLKSIAPPKIAIESPEYGDTVYNSQKAFLKFSAEKNSIDMLNYSVFVNNIPVISSSEKQLNGADQHAFQRQLNIPLFNQTNKIRIEVFNGKSMGLAETLIYRQGDTAYKQKGDLYLLSVGINKFINMPEYNLMYAADDAESFSAFFNLHHGETFNKIHIKTISDNTLIKPSKENILNSLEFLKQATANDTVIIFLASHGLSDNAGDYFFMPNDATFKTDSKHINQMVKRGIAILPQNLRSLISWESFFDILRSVAGKRLLIVDTCQAKKISGTLDIHSLAKRSASSSFALLAASKGDEYSQEYSEGKHGLFTFALLNGIQGNADENKDGHVTLSELYSFVSIYVNNNRNKKIGEQTPQIAAPNELNDMILYSYKIDN